MLTSIRGLMAATFAMGAFVTAPALATETGATETGTDEAHTHQTGTSDTGASETSSHDAAIFNVVDVERAVETSDSDRFSYAAADATPGFEISANAALVSEYRFRGVDLSGGDLAIQGGIDLSLDAGFYIGTWGSSIDEDTVGFGHTEVDVYGGFGGDLAEGVGFDLGVIAYLYPNAGPGDFDYVELYGSLGFEFGPVETTVGVAYAPEQDSLGSEDNFYIYTDVGIGIPSTPLSISGHLGYTDGFLTFTDDSKAFDWSVGVDFEAMGPLSVGVAYVGAEGDIAAGDYDYVDDAVVLTLSASF